MTTNHQFNQDYKNNCFKYPELTKIHGEPSTGTLLTLQNEIKANAQTVNSVLGAGAHGYLGLVCTPPVYATIPGTAPYICLVNPGALNLQPNATQYQISQARDVHYKSTRLF